MNECITVSSRRVAAPAAAIFLALTPLISAQAPPPGSGSFDITGPIRVIDGDTLEVYIEGRQSGLGIIGIRAPMGNTACGKAALAHLRGLIARGMRLDEDPQIGYDARKRRMYYVKTPAGLSVAVQMARSALALPTNEGVEANEIAATFEAAANSGVGCVRR
jgi:endonuclease YncB( thermonuclease family)